MPPSPPFGREPLTRAELPDVFTPETVRRLDLRTVRRLSQPRNGVLSADEQRAFDDALRSAMQGTTDRLDPTLRRARRPGPADLDPDLRRSYRRARERLASQARQAQENLPELTGGWGAPPDAPLDASDDASTPVPSTDARDDVSLGSFESAVEQTSDTLEILERIASMQQQQLEHQRSQALRDVRGLFFALLVSVAVIIAGVAPLVDAAPHERRLILVWTLVVCGLAGLGYAVARAGQSARARAAARAAAADEVTGA